MSSEHVLVRIGRDRFKKTRDKNVHLVDDPEANAFLNDLEHYPHAFVLACCMDRQTKAERAWMIPVKVKKAFGTFEMIDLASKSIEEYKAVFSENNLHRFNDTMAFVFFRAVQLIHGKYSDDASNIWKNCPSSASVVYRFLEFDGVGIKIATMATNILARQFRVPFSDYSSIDVSPDVHVKRVMSRIGLISSDADNDMIIYKARELCPEFPGIIDFSLWEIGRTWCRPENPGCDRCLVSNVCQYQTKANPSINKHFSG